MLLLSQAQAVVRRYRKSRGLPGRGSVDQSGQGAGVKPVVGKVGVGKKPCSMSFHSSATRRPSICCARSTGLSISPWCGAAWYRFTPKWGDLRFRTDSKSQLPIVKDAARFRAGAFASFGSERDRGIRRTTARSPAERGRVCGPSQFGCGSTPAGALLGQSPLRAIYLYP